MKAYDLLIAGGTIITELGTFHGWIAVRDGRIAAVGDGPPAAAADTVDARGLLVLPGGVDPHCHFCEPGEEEREDLWHGTMGAAAGGITTACDMWTTDPPLIDARGWEAKAARVVTRAVIDVAFWAGVIPGEATDYSDLHRRGAIGFKAYMAGKPRGRDFADGATILSSMREVASLGAIFTLHAEDGEFIRSQEEHLRRSGRVDAAAYPESRPVWQEIAAVERAIAMAKDTGVRLHLLHVSHPGVAAVVRRAKAEGVPVTAETCPQYLTLSLADYERMGPFAKCAPPLRAEPAPQQMWAYLNDGTIDYVAADHYPATHEQKARGQADIWAAPNGLNGVQLTWPLLLTEGVHRNRLSLSQFVRLTSSNAARIFGLYPQKGSLLPGSDADLALVDPEAKWVVRPEDLYTKNNTWSPFAGRMLRGRVVRTMLRGRTVYANGEFPAGPGYGCVVGSRRPERREPDSSKTEQGGST